MSCLDVNDVLEELIEENERLNRELIFANRLLKVLLEMKYNLMNKLKFHDGSLCKVLFNSDINEFINLEEQFKNICLDNNVVINQEVIVSVEQNSAERVDEQISTEILYSDEEVEQRGVEQLVERIDHIINEISEESEEQDSEQETDNQQDQQVIELHDKQIGEHDLHITNINNEEDEQIPYVDGHTDNYVIEQLTQEYQQQDSELTETESYQQDNADDEGTIIVENNIDLHENNISNINEQVINNEKQLDINLEQSNDRTNKQQEEYSGPSTSKSVSDKPDKCKTSQIKERPRIRPKKLVTRKYNLRKRRKSHPIKYREKIGTSKKDLDEDDKSVRDKPQNRPGKREINQTRRRPRIKHKELARKKYNLRNSPKINCRKQIDTSNHFDKDDIPTATTSKSKVSTSTLTETCDSTNERKDRMITEIRFFVCNYNGCGKVLKTREGLIDHRQTHINQPEENSQQLFFRCNYCHKIFSTKQSVVRHQKKSHKSMIVFKCHFKNCGKEFDSNISLTQHFAIHTQGKESGFKGKNVSQNLSRVKNKQFNCEAIQVS